eukprot:TRINITY_DN37122_c0_g1_i1.p1 TRINITY_DN37122_c0_g1~~TRINITY_DN37122_c0_g1_i1.p1  ORF type:complete len:252 (+),score=35.65 TRINITY_DN37122_c0_g1_i1:73-828(+)
MWEDLANLPPAPTRKGKAALPDDSWGGLAGERWSIVCLPLGGGCCYQEDGEIVADSELVSAVDVGVVATGEGNSEVRAVVTEAAGASRKPPPGPALSASGASSPNKPREVDEEVDEANKQALLEETISEETMYAAAEDFRKNERLSPALKSEIKSIRAQLTENAKLKAGSSDVLGDTRDEVANHPPKTSADRGRGASGRFSGVETPRSRPLAREMGIVSSSFAPPPDDRFHGFHEVGTLPPDLPLGTQMEL